MFDSGPSMLVLFGGMGGGRIHVTSYMFWLTCAMKKGKVVYKITSIISCP